MKKFVIFVAILATWTATTGTVPPRTTTAETPKYSLLFGVRRAEGAKLVIQPVLPVYLHVKQLEGTPTQVGEYLRCFAEQEYIGPAKFKGESLQIVVSILHCENGTAFKVESLKLEGIRK